MSSYLRDYIIMLNTVGTYHSIGGTFINGQVLVWVLDILKSNNSWTTNVDGELGKLTTPSCTLDNTAPDPEGLVRSIGLKY